LSPAVYRKTRLALFKATLNKLWARGNTFKLVLIIFLVNWLYSIPPSKLLWSVGILWDYTLSGGHNSDIVLSQTGIIHILPYNRISRFSFITHYTYQWKRPNVLYHSGHISCISKHAVTYQSYLNAGIWNVWNIF
jgi:hypothetical protein